MAEPLKDMYSEGFLRGFAARVRGAYEAFEEEAFVAAVQATDWERLALKARMRRIAVSLAAALPPDYGRALDVLEAIADECRGFPYLFFPDFVETFGLEHWERSVAALERFTPLSSSEFAVRPFIVRDPERMMAQMVVWSGHGDEHVRRLASEGCRPRLPWGDALREFKRDPSPVLPILERLKADPSEYVRRSVANNLNDISKDHPELVLDLAAAWLGVGEPTDRLLRHACRGLMKAAHPRALALFGIASQPDVAVEAFVAEPAQAPIGGSVQYRYALRVPEGEPVKLRLELAVYYPRSTGKLYRKLFKLSERTAEGGARLQGGRALSFADLSTRRHYPGTHKLALVVNGEEAAYALIELGESGPGADSEADSVPQGETAQ